MTCFLEKILTSLLEAAEWLLLATEVVDKLCYKTPTLSLGRRLVLKGMYLLEENPRAHVTTVGEKTSHAKRVKGVMARFNSHA